MQIKSVNALAPNMVSGLWNFLESYFPAFLVNFGTTANERKTDTTFHKHKLNWGYQIKK